MVQASLFFEFDNKGEDDGCLVACDSSSFCLLPVIVEITQTELLPGQSEICSVTNLGRAR